MAHEHLEHAWPCVFTAYDQCPGVGESSAHCAACHEVFLGNVTLCPMHRAAQQLLIAVGEFLTIDDWSDDFIASARIVTLAQNAYTQARLPYTDTATAYATLLTPSIAAEVHTDSHVLEVLFDAAPWFAQAGDENIIALHAIEWRGNYASDEVALYFESNNTEISALLKYCRSVHGTRGAEGFECSVNAEQAMAWLKLHRSGLWARLLCQDNGVRLVEAQEDDVRGMWNWLDGDGNASEQSFKTIHEAALDAANSLKLEH